MRKYKAKPKDKNIHKQNSQFMMCLVTLFIFRVQHLPQRVHVSNKPEKKRRRILQYFILETFTPLLTLNNMLAFYTRSTAVFSHINAFPKPTTSLFYMISMLCCIIARSNCVGYVVKICIVLFSSKI